MYVFLISIRVQKKRKSALWVYVLFIPPHSTLNKRSQWQSVYLWRCHRPQLICKIPNTNMDACTGVEKEVDKVLSKFGGINDHADRTLGDLCMHIESLKNSIEEGRSKLPMTPKETLLYFSPKNDYISSLFCAVFLRDPQLNPVAAPSNQELTAAQIIIMKQAASKVKDTVQRLASDHRDLHSTVSKVGKAIDRVRELHNEKIFCQAIYG